MVHQLSSAVPASMLPRSSGCDGACQAGRLLSCGAYLQAHEVPLPLVDRSVHHPGPTGRYSALTRHFRTADAPRLRADLGAAASVSTNATSAATFSGLMVQAAARPLHGDQRYRFPYPGGNNGFAMSSGTSSSCCSTWSIDLGSSNGRLPRGERSPNKVSNRTSSET